MMVAEITNERQSWIWWNMDIVEGLHYVILWWQRRSQEVQIAGGHGFSVLRSTADAPREGVDTIL